MIFWSGRRGSNPRRPAWEHAWELFISTLCINGVHPDHRHAWFFGLLVMKARYRSNRSNELWSTRRPLWPLGSFAQPGAPDQVRRSREVSVGTYTFWRCMPVRNTAKTRSGIRKCGAEKDPAGSCHIEAKAPGGRGNRAGSEEPGTRDAELVL